MNETLKGMLIITSGASAVVGFMSMGRPIVALYFFVMAGVIIYFVGRAK